MKVEAFFKKFSELTEAREAVNRVRELILRLATSGRIAEQNPNDKSGDILLKEIFEVRKVLARSRSAKDRDENNPIEAGDTIDLPPSWSRCMISEVCDLKTGATPSRVKESYFGGEIPWLVSGDINRIEINECEGRITQEGLVNSNCKIIPENSVLIALNGQGKTRGSVAMLRIPAALNQSLVAIIPYSSEHLLPEFVFWNLKGRYFAIRDITGQDQRRGLNMKLIGQLTLPIPPLEEQKRIVEKVDELMALCDQLESQLRERETRQVALARASLARFVADPTPANLELLFHPSFDIDPADLRKAILNLAVQGKLVPQYPNDESVEKTFPKLQAVSIKAKSDKCPAQWLSVPMGKLGEWRGGGTPSKSSTEFWKGDIPWVSPKDMKTLYIADAQDHISSEAVENSSAKLIPPGSLLMVVRGMILARTFPVALSTREVTINQDMKALIPSDPRTIDFLLLASRAFEPKILDAIEHSSHGTCKLKTAALHELHMPIPPLGEQRRIVAKANALLALVDELEDYQKESKAKAEGLLAALVIAIAVPQSLSAVAESKPQGSQTFIHPCVFLAAEITDRLHDHNTFGQTKLQKVVYLAEYCLQLPEVESSYVRYQRGPHDPGLIERIEAGLFENQWFEVQTRSEGIGKQYSRLGGDERYHDLVRLQWQGKAKEIRDLADMLRNWSSEECEIFATLFAAWNDFIIHGEEVTDEKIINEVLYNWHEEKQRISKPTWQNRLDWMKAIGFIPTGYGKPTKPKPQPRLF